MTESNNGRSWQGETDAFQVGLPNRIAQEVIRQLNPRRLLDASCGSGLLVKGFRDRNVDAWGIDFSAEAIAAGPDEVRPYCQVVQPGIDFGARHDLVICVNAPQHVVNEGFYLRMITSVTDSLLFAPPSLAPGGPIAGNGKNTIEWVELFAAYGFAPNIAFDASFASPHALLLQRRGPLPADVARLFSESIDLRYIAARDQSHERGATTAVELARYKERVTVLEEQLAREQEYLESLHGVHACLVREVQKLRAGSSTGALSPASVDIDAVVARVRSEIGSRQISGGMSSGEIRQLLQHQTELRASIVRLERRATGVERSVQGLTDLVNGILQSRIWQTLVRLGGMALGVTGRGQKK